MALDLVLWQPRYFCLSLWHRLVGSTLGSSRLSFLLDGLLQLHRQGIEIEQRLGVHPDHAVDDELEARQADADGLVRHTLDLGQAPFGSGPGMVTPGSTWHFQWWLRDPSAGAGSNASSAVSVTFCP